MERVEGIGGLFFRAKDPKGLADWYETRLGVRKTGEPYEEGSWWQKSGPTVFAPFEKETDYLGARQQQWMVNFRVRDLDAMVSQLRDAGIEVRIEEKVYPNGRLPI